MLMHSAQWVTLHNIYAYLQGRYGSLIDHAYMHTRHPCMYPPSENPGYKPVAICYFSKVFLLCDCPYCANFMNAVIVELILSKLYSPLTKCCLQVQDCFELA